ncbi:TonB-dependent receptor [Ulvibacterium sp.]|uniref:TonB-dependent receptor n=1 Tax=Ulvibacterium sp. TaxID=2665914 RepID=UPI0026175629|nr:TonB-dependent receptor [Ulvibacterium sp.]
MKQRLLFFLLFPIMALSQNRYTITGTVLDSNGAPVAFANVVLSKGNKYAVVEQNGTYRIKNVRRGSYEVSVSSLGFETITRNITVSENLTLNFELSESVENLDDVTVTAKSEATNISQKAITISSLDVKQVADLSLGAEEVLRTSTGVVVRQSGGLGSNLNINLNGLTGQAVRIYYDGIPIQVFGNGIQLNNIPVDALERVDVYKGVMPVDVGTDALGGGINLVPAQQNQDYLRASYSIGSFNTHRATLNANRNLNDNTSLSVLSYFNYSDNDYTMRNIPSIIENVDENGDVISVSEEVIEADRFHNRHTSAFAEVSLKLKNRSWTDLFAISTSISSRFDEIQQGNFIINTAVGEAERDIIGFNQRLEFRKKLFKEKGQIRYYGTLSNTTTKSNDSTAAIYNWRGEVLRTPNSSGAEIFAIPTLREGDELGTAHRLLFKYALSDNLDITLSEFFRYSRIRGEDPVGFRIDINGESIDPNTVPSKLSRNIVGLEVEKRFFDERLTAIGFFKNYVYSAESIDILAGAATTLPVREVSENENGFGFALKYQVIPSVFIRGSFERAVRIPTETEVFGDFAATLPNYELRPEKSENFNAGITYEEKFGKDFYLTLQVDGFIRDQQDLIRLDDFGPENAIFVNQAEVDGEGIEVSLRLSPIGNLNISGNLTYQSNEISGGDSTSNADLGNQVPNIPNFFYNVGANYRIDNIFGSNNSLRFDYTYFFTDRFSINEVADLDTANPIFLIPEQNLHNGGITYSLTKKGLSFSLNFQNIFDAEVFDNFRIPRPGFNYAFKINYKL